MNVNAAALGISKRNDRVPTGGGASQKRLNSSALMRHESRACGSAV